MIHLMGWALIIIQDFFAFLEVDRFRDEGLSLFEFLQSNRGVAARLRLLRGGARKLLLVLVVGGSCRWTRGLLQWVAGSIGWMMMLLLVVVVVDSRRDIMLLLLLLLSQGSGGALVVVDGATTANSDVGWMLLLLLLLDASHHDFALLLLRRAVVWML